MKIRSFTGSGVKTYIPSIAKLRTEIFREYPFLHAKNIDDETARLKKQAACKEAVAVLVFDGPKIVGASTGLPLEEESLVIQRPFIENGSNLTDYFYFDESVLLKPYRSRGLGHHFFDLREAHAKHLKRFQHACFCTVVRPKNHPRRPKECLGLEQFWRKRGYIEYPELRPAVSWRDLDEEIETPKPMVFWIKNLG